MPRQRCNKLAERRQRWRCRTRGEPNAPGSDSDDAVAARACVAIACNRTARTYAYVYVQMHMLLWTSLSTCADCGRLRQTAACVYLHMYMCCAYARMPMCIYILSDSNSHAPRGRRLRISILIELSFLFFSLFLVFPPIIAPSCRSRSLCATECTASALGPGPGLVFGMPAGQNGFKFVAEFELTNTPQQTAS